MTNYTRLIVSFGFLVAFAFTSACGGSSGAEAKCEKLLEKSKNLAMEMAKAMGGEDKVEEMEKEFEEGKAEGIEKCAKMLKEDKELEKAVDCVLEAKDMQAMMQCEGADKLKSAFK